jgi:hypothetical protein
VGGKRRKLRGSLERIPAKGYVLILTVDLKIDSWERMGE